jgi:hypothetical protein
MKDIPENANIVSQPVHSASLGYMLPANIKSQKASIDDDLSSRQVNRLTQKVGVKEGRLQIFNSYFQFIF